MITLTLVGEHRHGQGVGERWPNREIEDGQVVLHLRYVVGRGDNAQDTVNVRIALQTTASAVGGVGLVIPLPSRR